MRFSSPSTPLHESDDNHLRAFFTFPLDINISKVLAMVDLL